MIVENIGFMSGSKDVIYILLKLMNALVYIASLSGLSK